MLSPPRRLRWPCWHGGGGGGVGGAGGGERQCQRAITAAFEGGTQLVNAKCGMSMRRAAMSTFTGAVVAIFPIASSGSLRPPTVVCRPPALTCRAAPQPVAARDRQCAFCPRCGQRRDTQSLHLRNIFAPRGAQPADLQHTATNARCGEVGAERAL